MRACDLAKKAIVHFMNLGDEQYQLDPEDRDWKDDVTAASSGYELLAEDLDVWWGMSIPRAVMPPDGYSCPRAFASWDDSLFMETLTRMFSAKNRRWRKAYKLYLK